MIAAGILLALSNSTAYSSTIYDPVIVLLAFWTGLSHSHQLARTRAFAVGIYTVAVLVAALTIGGAVYMKGIKQTILDRTSGTDSPLAVLQSSWGWTSLVVYSLPPSLLSCR